MLSADGFGDVLWSVDVCFRNHPLSCLEVRGRSSSIAGFGGWGHPPSRFAFVPDGGLKPTLRSHSYAPSKIVEPVNDPSIKKEKPKREKVKVEKKNDPKLVKAARELRDRYLEEINQNPILTSNGKYEVSRLIESNPTGQFTQRPMPMLEVAELKAA